ncbi:hypothetical protein [Methyloglobulus sp.]
MSALGATIRKLIQICYGVLKHQHLINQTVNGAEYLLFLPLWLLEPL